MNQPVLTLFYDGLCPLCSREIVHYRKRAASDSSVQFIDISDSAFDAAAHGLDAQRIHQVMHVKEGEQILTGVDAFRAVWRRIPGHGFLTWLSSVPGMLLLMRGVYFLFAWLRLHLPRRKPACHAGTCRK